MQKWGSPEVFHSSHPVQKRAGGFLNRELEGSQRVGVFEGVAMGRVSRDQQNIAPKIVRKKGYQKDHIHIYMYVYIIYTCI